MGGPPGGGAVNTTLPLVLGIVCVLCCGCVPGGIIAIVFAVQAKGLADQGNTAEAMAKARTANIVAGVSMALGLLAGIVYAIMAAAAG